MTETRRLQDIAKEITSKNAGNFALTFDIVFDDAETYRRVTASGVINRAAMARLYGVPPERITHLVEFDQGNAIKITMRRPWVSGSIGESDVFGAQQYAPLLDVEVPWPR